MRKKTLLFGGAVVMLGSIILVSCNKSAEIKSTNTPTVTAENKAAGNKLVTLQDLAAADEAEQLAYALDPNLAVTVALNNGSCPPVITYDNPEGVYPRTVTTDWGTGCTYVAAGITRSGKVLRTYLGDMSQTTDSSFYIESYDNYYVKSAKQGYDSVKFEGRVKVKHMPKNNGTLDNAFRVVQQNKKLTEINGDYIIYTGAKRFTKREDDGGLPDIKPQGWFKITGVEFGDVFSSGVSYQYADSIDDANPLIYKHCDFVVAGLRFIGFTNQPSWIVDYGNVVNNCDDQALLTIGGGSPTPVTLPLNLW